MSSPALLAVGAAGLALLAVPGTPALAVGVLLGFGLGWSWPGLMNFAVVRLHPQAPAAATSITQTGVYAGGCLGPLSLGAVAAARRLPDHVDRGRGGDAVRVRPDARRERDAPPPRAGAGLTPRLSTVRPHAQLVRSRSAQLVRSRSAQLVRSAMKSQSASIARRGEPSGSGASCARASSA